MNSSECWIGMHENCLAYEYCMHENCLAYEYCACICHSEGFSWVDADVQKFKETPNGL